MGDLVVDTELALVKAFDDEIFLSVQEYRILRLLMNHPQEVVLRSNFNEVLNILDVTQEGTLNVAIGRLRKKLNGVAKIEAVVNKGYRITV